MKLSYFLSLCTHPLNIFFSSFPLKKPTLSTPSSLTTDDIELSKIMPNRTSGEITKKKIPKKKESNLIKDLCMLASLSLLLSFFSFFISRKKYKRPWATKWMIMKTLGSLNFDKLIMNRWARNQEKKMSRCTCFPQIFLKSPLYVFFV